MYQRYMADRLARLDGQQECNRSGLSVRIAVEIRKAGARTETFTRNVRLKAARPKKKSKKRG